MAVRPYLVVGFAVAVGCASGTEESPFGVGNSAEDGGETGSTFTSSISAASTLEGGTSTGMGEGTAEGDEFDDEDGTTVSLDAADDDADAGADTTSTGAPADESTTGDSDGGETTDGGSSSGGEESTSTGVAIMCPQELTCPMAPGLGSVSGDTTSPILLFNGSDPTWLEFQVSEDNDDVVGEELNFTVTLTSPACCDFDLYVYRSVEGGASGCGGFEESSISVGAVDTVSMDWGEGLVANGVDDDVVVAVEIVPKNDECDDMEEWALQVEGDL